MKTAYLTIRVDGSAALKLFHGDDEMGVVEFRAEWQAREYGYANGYQVV